MELKDKVVVITGGSKGLGRSLAEELIKEGAKVAICSPNEEEIKKAGEDIGALAVVADVRSERDMQKLADETIKKYGGLDIWINNAGKWLLGSPEETDMDKAKEMFDVNVIGAINGFRVAIRHMRENDSGTIINILSKVALGIRPGLSMYVASKWALNGFIKTAREEIKDDNISLLSVFPGGIKTSLYDEAEALPSTYPNYMEPEEVAKQIIENLKKQNPEQDLVILKEGENILKNEP